MTTESSDVRGIAAARTACGAFVLALLISHGSLPAVGQEGASERALLERLRQIQGQLELGREQASGQPSRAEELIGQLGVIEAQLRSEAAAGVPPALDEDEVRRLVREGLGVDVLRAELVEREGQPVYVLTVMNPPGDYNEAFMVRTLLIDGATGGLLGQVPHTPRAAAPDLPQDMRAPGADDSGLEIRRRTYR